MGNFWRSVRVLLVIIGLALIARAVFAQEGQTDLLFERNLFDTRADLEFLADRVYEGSRPPIWTGNTDTTSPTALADLWFDNEQIADQVFGAGIRPEGWIGATTANPSLLLRNIRHDLEFTADEVFAEEGRPPEWRGTTPITRCSRTLQNLYYVFQQSAGLQSEVPQSALDFCRSLEVEADDRLVRAALASDPSANPALPELILAVRGDLERLADEKLGLGTRPPGWIGTTDVSAPTLVSDNFLDLELLATTLLGGSSRPDGWIGTTSTAAAIAYRNLRHDLELLADVAMGIGVRPRGWQGVDPIVACTPTQQNLVLITQQFYPEFTLPPIPEGETAPPDYCAQAEAAANFIIENPPVPPPSEEGVAEDVDQRFVAEAEWAFTYLDTGGLLYMGQMPLGTQFRAWYRNFGESTMMFVTGDGFAVWIDRRWTTMSPETHRLLPVPNGVRPLTFCDAGWCNGPGPTPTPTGSGPIDQLLFANTPLPTAPSQEDLRNTLIQVSWNHIRVTYVQDNVAGNLARVALEICAEPAQIACEPVTRVFDNNTGLLRSSVGTYNGLNVYEFTYGYSTNLIVEGATRFSPDIWISDPTIR